MLSAPDHYPPPIIIPHDNRVYAIGDIQGRKEILEILLGMVKKDLCDHPLQPDQKYSFCFLGDYVDRGPDVKGVIDILVGLQKENSEHVFLEGNHDEAFSKVLDYLKGDRSVDEDFVRSITISGSDTCASYGVRVKSAQEWEISQVKPLLEKVPPAHVKFFKNLPHSAIFGKYLLIHNPYESFGKREEFMTQEEYIAIQVYLYPWVGDSTLDPYHPIRQSMLVHGHISVKFDRSCELTNKRIGLCDSKNFYYYVDDPREPRKRPDASEQWSHCAVLEKDQPTRFLSASVYTYRGPGG